MDGLEGSFMCLEEVQRGVAAARTRFGGAPGLKHLSQHADPADKVADLKCAPFAPDIAK